MGLRPIQAKIALESRGLVKPGRIAEWGGVKPENVPMLKSKLNQLEQEGFGTPATRLRKKLLKKLSGNGLSLPGGGLKQKIIKKGKASAEVLGKKITSHIVDKVLPDLLKKLQSGSGLKLAGQGMGGMRKAVHMAVLRDLNDGASRDGSTLVGTGVLKNVAKSTGRIIFPLLVKKAQMVLKKKLGLQGSGLISEIKKMGGPLLMKLNKAFLHSLARFVKNKFMPQKGTGMCGAGFDDFLRGFAGVLKKASLPIQLLGKATGAKGF
jgi:hypothetical protein